MLTTIRTAACFHAMWSAFAVCLFLFSGVLGYLALMESVAVATSPEESVVVRLLQCEVLPPQKRTEHQKADPMVQFAPWWGYSIGLRVAVPQSADGPSAKQPLPILSGNLADAGQAADGEVQEIVVLPVIPLKWVAEQLQRGLSKSGVVHVYRDGMQSGVLRVRELGQSSGVMLPILCAILGVLCLATSLRYQSDFPMRDAAGVGASEPIASATSVSPQILPRS